MTDETPRDAVPRAVQACHELLAWLIPQLDLFPRARRFTLGERLETGFHLAPTLQRGSQSRRSSVLVLLS